jgi:uncharacterized protein with NAD-binding domain and iron-sulfur cluster
MTGYAEPFDSWGEMSELLPREDWPETGAPRSIEYFCATMKEPPVLSPARASATVKAEAIAWLAREVPTLWPRFDWSMLHDPKERKGEERFDAQYWRANIDPSERYVLSPPGSIQYRKRADESEVDNLFLAGDWLATSINGGSVEAAVEGGMQAARAICGVPEEIHGDHGESRAPANSL